MLLSPAGAGAQDAAAQKPSGDASPVTFWQSLGDTTLERLVSRALAANRDVRATDARSEAARAQRFEAALDLAPTVRANAGYTRQRLSSASFPGLPSSLPDQDMWEAGLELSWDLDVFGRTRNSLRGRNALVDASEEDSRDVQVLVAAQVAQAYFDLRGREDRLTVARQNAENQRSTLELTQDRLAAGRGTALDVERAQAQLSSTLAELPALEADIDAIRRRIAVLVGDEPAVALPASDPSAPPMHLPRKLVVTDQEATVQRRPDVQSAESRRSAQGAFVRSAQASYLPSVSLGGVAGYTAHSFDALGESGTPRFALGATISWAFLDLGRVKSRVDEAQANQAEADAQYEQTVLRARAEIETSLASYRRARERLRHLEDAAEASERATELARLRFTGGATDFLEVLDAERRQLEAQDRLAAGYTEVAGWLVAVYRATGGSAAIPGA
jgi:NodT family efflux transporter outer membrane factor (OMF) lipoprotein